MLKLISKLTKELSNDDIQKICKLKDSQWKFGKKSQLIWFKKNVKSFDIHNCFYIKKYLIGYTSLKKRKLEIFSIKAVTQTKQKNILDSHNVTHFQNIVL